MSGIKGFQSEGQRQYASWAGCVTWIEGDGISTADAIAAAGLDWSVEMTPVYAPAPDAPGDSAERLQVIPNRYALRRTDTGAYFVTGVTGQYQPVQNADAFNFGDDILGGQDAPWVSGGSIREGAVVYMQARLGADIRIGGMESERIDPLLTISNAHDGTGSFIVNMTPVRVVCENTFRMARGDMQRAWRMQHRTTLQAKATEAREALQLAFTYYAKLAETGEALLAKTLDAKAQQRFLRQLIPYDLKADLDKDRSARNRAEAQAAVAGILASKEDLQKVNGTAWGMYQAVADYSDHHRGDGRDTDVASAAENRFYRIVFAEGKREGGLKDRALELLLK